MAVKTTTTPRNAQSTAWHDFPVLAWQWLTEPTDAIRELEHRRRARLLAALLSLLIPLGTIGALVAPVLLDPAYRPLDDPFFYTAAGGMVVLIISYLFSRGARYQLGAVLALLTISATTLVGVAVFPQGTETLLIYLVMAILLSSLLLPLYGTVILAFVNLLAAMALPLFVPAITATDVFNPLTFVVIISILIIVAANIRQQDLDQIEAQSRELSEAVQQARMANQLKDQFLATMSHELRTPLNAIIGFAEVMQMGLAGEIPSQAARAIDRIHFNSERLLKLIDDILDISKIEAGRVELIRRPFNLETFIKNIESTMRSQAEEKGLEFVATMNGELPAEIVGDRQRLEQVVLNLTSNAVKFTEAGSVTISVQRAGEAEWEIAVADTGIGIPPHAQEIIFEKFRQVDGTSRRAYGGTGLGLAITRELVLLMDGSVKVKSKPGEGSTFTVTLPLLTSEEETHR